MTQTITCAPDLYDEMRQKFGQGRQRTFDFAAIEIRTSTVFPSTHECPACAGTGHGKSSTYCRHCRGAGKIKTIGMWTGSGQTVTMITAPLPKAFQPRFPIGIVAAPQMCRGLV